jgi:hypothetical protein
MKDNHNKDLLKNGEKPPTPKEARLHAIDGYLGAATVALGYDSDIIHQDGLDPFMGGQVADVFSLRSRQLADVPHIPAISLAENTEISPAARSAVMGTTVDVDAAPLQDQFNGFQEAA